MAADLPPVYIEFKGDVKDLQAALKAIHSGLKGVSKDAEQTGKDAKALSAKTVAAGTIMAHAIENVAGKVLQLGKEFVSVYMEVGGETRKLQRIIGGSAEEVSRLRFAAHEVGVSADTLGKGIRILSGHLLKNDDAAKLLGIDYRDLNGKLLPTNDILMNLAEKFSTMPNGLAKTALAVKAFGRSGTELIPVLNLGKKGLTAMYEEADKLGLTLTGQNLQDVKNFTMSQRHLKAAVSGLKIAVGKELVPQLSGLVTLISEKGIPMFQDFVNGLTGKNGLQGSLQGSASTAYKFGKQIVAVIKTVWAMRELLINIAGILVAMWAVGKISAGITAVVGMIGLVTAALTAQATAAAAATTATAAATGGTSLIAAGIGITAALALIGGIAWKVKKTFNEKFSDNTGLFGDQPKFKAPDLGADPGLDDFEKTDEKATVVRLIDTLKEEAAKVRASIKLKKLGASKGLIEAVMGSQDWQTEFNKLLTGGKAAVQKMQVLFNKTPAGVAEVAQGSSAIVMREIKKVTDAIEKVDVGFTSAKSKTSSIAGMQSVAKHYLAAIANAVTLAKAQEVKTRNTSAHAAAVAALNKAIKEQAKIQTYANSVTKQANALAKASAKAAAEAARQQALLSSTMNASNSWLSAQMKSAGPGGSNLGSFIEVPVIIDGQTVFRVTQKYSLLNNRRNPTNGLSRTLASA